MTDKEKREIIELRNSGLGYGEIAKKLNVSRSTISTFFNRQIDTKITNVCKECGKKLTNVPGKKEKVFCSDRCRYNWWNAKRKLDKEAHNDN